MLSRLSGLANVVLHELSGDDDTDQNMRAPLDPVSSCVLI
ncbi:GOLGB1 isoform 4 [Pongo abelii]|uniref:GOLGB1 isoform 4 n=1 Tax=Pongo abelii TaxID=9601 RepID=A0A2J8W207_PONAB|nr:GOLGB1 isoform 4 [Pongo abelii]